MPNGQYTLNPTSLTRAIRKHRTALLEFLKGKSPQAQSCQGFSLLEIEEIGFVENNARIKPIPLYVAAAFLRYWDKRGNEQASAIVEALTTGHLIALFDDAFGVKRSASERREMLFECLSPRGIIANQQLDKAIEQMERLIESQEAELALERSKTEQLQKITEVQTTESLRVLEERQGLRHSLKEAEQRYRKLEKAYQEVDKENRKLQRQLIDTSQDCLNAWKKIGTMHEQINKIRRQTLLVASKDGW